MAFRFGIDISTCKAMLLHSLDLKPSSILVMVCLARLTRGRNLTTIRRSSCVVLWSREGQGRAVLCLIFGCHTVCSMASSR